MCGTSKFRLIASPVMHLVKALFQASQYDANLAQALIHIHASFELDNADNMLHSASCTSLLQNLPLRPDCMAPACTLPAHGGVVSSGDHSCLVYVQYVASCGPFEAGSQLQVQRTESHCLSATQGRYRTPTTVYHCCSSYVLVPSYRSITLAIKLC